MIKIYSFNQLMEHCLHRLESFQEEVYHLRSKYAETEWKFELSNEKEEE